jgi:hypothetical protein
MATFSSSTVRTLKIKFDDDLRRVQVDVPSEGSASDKLRALRAAVGACFGISIADLPALKYQDDDRDLCTLIEASVEDMLTLAADGPLYLFASSADETSVEAQGTKDLAHAEEFQEEAVPADKSESLIAPLLAMGFAEADAITATEKAKGKLDVAVAILLKGSQPKQRSYLARLFPQFSGSPDQSAVLQHRDPPQEDLPEVDAFLLSNSATVDERNANTHSHSDMTMNEDVAANGLLLRDETVQVDSFGEAVLAEVEVVEESPSDCYDAERVPMSLDSNEASYEGAAEEAFARSANASAMDKGQMLVSRVLSALRTRQTVSESSVVADEEIEINVRSHADDTMNDDIAVGTLQNCRNETEHVDSCEEAPRPDDEVVQEADPQISGSVQEAGSSQDVLLVEASAEHHDTEHMSAASASDEASLENRVRDTSEQTTNASLLDQGQLFATCLLSSVRTRQFIPESISSSGPNETRLDRVQRCISDSLFDLRSKMQRSPLPQA